MAFLLCLTVMPAQARAEEGLYGVLGDDGATLTYYYGEHDVVWSNTTESGSVSAAWYLSKQEADKVNRVVFDDSARKFRPIALENFFGWVKTGAGESMSILPYAMPNLWTIEGIDKVDTSACKNMKFCFYCPSLNDLDISAWNVSNVTDMSSMFSGCSSLTDLDLSGWDTRSLTNAYDMFDGCSSLYSLDLSSWNTSSVSRMGSMFRGCSHLTELDLSGWDTSSVLDMSGMFKSCDNLEVLKLGKDFEWVKRNTELRSGVVWCSSVDGKAYEPDEIPSNVAAVYTAAYLSEDAPASPAIPGGIRQVIRQSMYRLYNPYSGEHFYTASADEMGNLANIGWHYEGVGWDAPKKSQTPVYRLYNPYAGDHHYTTSAEERDQLKAVGWNDEGVGWYSAESDGVPLYRQYNPYATVGTHNYTTSREENDGLVSVGWRAEGIGWYGLG